MPLGPLRLPGPRPQMVVKAPAKARMAAVSAPRIHPAGSKAPVSGHHPWGLGRSSCQTTSCCLKHPRPRSHGSLGDPSVAWQAARLGRAGGSEASEAQAVPRLWRRRGEKTLFLFPQVPPPPSLHNKQQQQQRQPHSCHDNPASRQLLASGRRALPHQGWGDSQKKGEGPEEGRSRIRGQRPGQRSGI